MSEPLPAGLLEEISLGSARGKRSAEPLTIEVIRELTPEDLPAIQAPPPVAAPAPTIKSLRASHHRLAELIAQGIPGVQISRITGYSQSYISTKKSDPAFVELVAYYTKQKEQVFVDVLERMRSLGLDTLEQLQEEMEQFPEKYPPRLKMELVELMLLKPIAVGAQAKAAMSGQSGGQVSLEVRFVGARQAQQAPVIDVTTRGPHDEP